LTGWRPFPLILTFSLGEKVQPLAAGKKRAAGEQNSASVTATNWERFSLYPGERAGVRGNLAHGVDGYSIIENAIISSITAIESTPISK